MAAVQVRSLPEDVYTELVRTARENGRSIASQVAMFIQQGLVKPEQIHTEGIVDKYTGIRYPDYQTRRQAALEELQDMNSRNTIPASAGAEETVRFIHEAREERANRIMSCLS